MSDNIREKIERKRKEIEERKKRLMGSTSANALNRPRAPVGPTPSATQILEEVKKIEAPQPQVVRHEAARPEPLRVERVKSEPVIVRDIGVFSVPSQPKPELRAEEVQVYIEREKVSDQRLDSPRKGQEEAVQEEVKEEEPTEMTDAQIREYCARTLVSHDFGEFFNKCSRIVEKALNKRKLKNKQDEVLSPMCTFNSILSNSKTCVGCLEWSPLYRELVMASYLPHTKLNEGLGTICLWSIALQSTPEFVLNCHSPATSVTFNRFDHNLILAGSYSGQIIVWDLRKRLQPVQKTAMMAESHSHPIYTLSIVGSQFANNIVSASSDGRVCVWSLSMFSKPTSTLDMKSRVKDVGCTTMAFPEGETNMFYMGAEDGTLIQSQLHGNKIAGNEANIFEGHEGPITGLDLNKYGEGYMSDVSNGLLLSSSVDWTVKLWNPKTSKTPLASFEIYDDYVFDAKWNPQHPAKFATVDGTGKLDLWNLNKDMEHPEYREETSKHVLNKVAWSNDGRMLATGSSMGDVTVYSTDAEYTSVRSDDLSKLERNLTLGY